MFPPVQLEPFAQKVIAQSEANPVDVTTLHPKIIRQAEIDVVANDPSTLEGLPDVYHEEVTIKRADGSEVELTITRPLNTEDEVLRPIVYFHGGGWAIGSKITHRRTCYELTTRAHAAVIFVDYSLSPEVRFPVAPEECYDAVAWVADENNAASIKVDPKKLVVAGDSAGGNLSAVVSIMAKQRGKIDMIKGQVLYYPVTDCNFETSSYQQFGEHHYLTTKLMHYFFDHYIPNQEDRKNILACPLNATIDDLKDLPRALVITAEADVLRDEGEAYARKLLAAGNDVVASRYLGMIHGVFNLPHWAPSADAIIDQTVQWLKKCN